MCGHFMFLCVRLLDALFQIALSCAPRTGLGMTRYLEAVLAESVIACANRERGVAEVIRAGVERGSNLRLYSEAT